MEQVILPADLRLGVWGGSNQARGGGKGKGRAVDLEVEIDKGRQSRPPRMMQMENLRLIYPLQSPVSLTTSLSSTPHRWMTTRKPETR
jgi:hypothetical protein